MLPLRRWWFRKRWRNGGSIRSNIWGRYEYKICGRWVWERRGWGASRILNWLCCFRTQRVERCGDQTTKTRLNPKDAFAVKDWLLFKRRVKEVNIFAQNSPALVYIFIFQSLPQHVFPAAGFIFLLWQASNRNPLALTFISLDWESQTPKILILICHSFKNRAAEPSVCTKALWCFKI